MACTQKLIDFEDRPRRERKFRNAVGGSIVTSVLTWIGYFSGVVDVGGWLVWGAGLATDAWRWADSRVISIQINGDVTMQQLTLSVLLGGCMGVGLFGFVNACIYDSRQRA